ncbi:MAG: MvaI/BcnI family restriction endonuclease [Methermicoccaceae archaeon]
MLTYEQVVKRLKEIKDMGYVRTHRAGDTGIGKTLEDLLGIHENNIPGPDAQQIELKAARKGSKSMITLFTKSPMPKNANPLLLRRYGYPSARGNRRKELHTTVNAVSFNSLKGEPGFKIEVRSDRIECVDVSIQWWATGHMRHCEEVVAPS